MAWLKIDPFSYDRYKDYLRAWIGAQSNAGYGAKSRIARALECTPGYLTAVLSEDGHLSAEQAEALTRLFRFEGDEIDFWLILVLRDRARSDSLRALLSDRLAKLRAVRARGPNRETGLTPG